MECIFCKIVSGELPSYKIYEDEQFFSFLDISPICQGHTLLIPKKHIVDIFDTPDIISDKYYSIIKLLSTAVKESLFADGINILQSNGVAAGQVVFHSHIHIIPRYSNDNISVTGNNRTNVNVSESVFRDIAEKIKVKI